MDLITSLFWLSLNTYFEARNQSNLGQKAVVHVVLNRARVRRLSVKQVLFQQRQFSWTLKGDPQKKTVHDLEALFICTQNTVEAINEDLNGDTFSDIEYYFNPDFTRPKWANKLTKVFTIKDDVFYKR